MTDYPGVGWIATAQDGGPSATYQLNMAAAPHRWMSLDAVFEREAIRPHFVAVDNLASHQVVAFDFGGIFYPVVGLTRQTFRVDPRASLGRITLTAGPGENLFVVWATFDLRPLDQVNFSGLAQNPTTSQTLTTQGAVQLATGPGTVQGISISIAGGGGETLSLYDSVGTNANLIMTIPAAAVATDIPAYGLAFATGLRADLEGTGAAATVTVFWRAGTGGTTL